ncbi:MAG: hypothetical protein A2Y14_01215 [Verrucomicrobia bacterium GWF2_51_19]|nr:MAG: hypothetical protein A2Y14_01215 [Verrucomicrobia bacterium GWF2_51_19]
MDMKRFLLNFGLLMAVLFAGESRVLVLPIQGEINKVQLYLLRRAVADAEKGGFNVLLLDMNTPGGDLQVTLDMMHVLQKFPGETLTFVHSEAVSAGSYLAIATDAIYFSPDGIMGAAAVISGDGKDVDKTLRLKIDSYLRARIRSITGEESMRGNVQRSMMDEHYEWSIGNAAIKHKGELLSLTAKEAVKKYNDKPLLAEGIFENIEALLKARYGTYTLERLKITWSEEFAKVLTGLAPILIGIGMLCLFLGIQSHSLSFGLLGLVLLVVVFLSNFVAGLSHHTELLVFFAGVLFVLLEVFLFTGTLFLGILGILCAVGALVWSFVDWSKFSESQSFFDILIAPLQTVGLGTLLALVGGFFLLRFLPKKWIWKKFFLTAASGVEAKQPDLTGAIGITCTPLMPSGQVSIDGKYYDAQVMSGFLDKNTKIRVCSAKQSFLVVEPL